MVALPLIVLPSHAIVSIVERSPKGGSKSSSSKTTTKTKTKSNNKTKYKGSAFEGSSEVVGAAELPKWALILLIVLIVWTICFLSAWMYFFNKERRENESKGLGLSKRRLVLRSGVNALMLMTLISPIVWMVKKIFGLNSSSPSLSSTGKIDDASMYAKVADGDRSSLVSSADDVSPMCTRPTEKEKEGGRNSERYEPYSGAAARSAMSPSPEPPAYYGPPQGGAAASYYDPTSK